jgi:orotate phosphoribosyltransferase-like protein
MRTIHNNPVEKYLKEHSDKKLSLRKIKNELNISKGAVFFLAMNSKKVRKVSPLEVGSDKNNLSVFTYNDVPDVISEVKIQEFDDTSDNIIDESS